MKSRLHIVSVLCLLFMCADSYADDVDQYPNFPFYVGFGFGYGDTDWNSLIDHDHIGLVEISAPSSAKTGGLNMQGFFGYHLSKYFSLEVRYEQYPDATVNFAHVEVKDLVIDGASLPFNIPVENPYNLYSFKTSTDQIAMVGKAFVTVSEAYHISVFADFGLSYEHRSDILTDMGMYMPTFGGGIMYRFAPRFLTSLDYEYTVGEGKSVMDPARYFMPFLYSINLKIAYLFKF